MKPDPHALRESARRFGQQHLFAFWDELTLDQRSALLGDVASIDFEMVSSLLRAPASGAAPLRPETVEPPDMLPPTPATPDQHERYERARRLGRELLESGKVAAMTVAGGQGTRLGFDAPKGTFPIGPVSGKSLFELFAESILATRRRYDAPLPWLIMTSDATDQATRAFFAQHDFFGLGQSTVHFFCQAMMPAVDDDGRIMLREKHRVAVSPNGHGGSLKALSDSGLIDHLLRAGVDIISYFQVDNPLVTPADPLFLGLHALAGSHMSSIAVRKTGDFEKVGVFARVDGVLQVIEYSDLPDALATARTPGGGRLLDAASVAIHLLCPRFVHRLTGTGSDLKLPWHRARKSVPFIDLTTGQLVRPDAPNATKFELFVFDALRLAHNPLVLEQPRSACFSPVKNSHGMDSVESAQRHMIARAAEWLERCGITVPRQPDGAPAAVLEISPLFALDAEQLAERIDRSLIIRPNERFYIHEAG